MFDVIYHGQRYTLAVIWVRRRESTVVVWQRLFARIAGIGLKMKRALLDLAFFDVPVIELLQ